MLNNFNEIIIIFLIIIFIGLSYYDLKYSIILCIVLYLIYIYFNKLTYETNYNEYKQYDENVDLILKQLEKFKNNDEQSYKLGLKYYRYFINNIELLYNLNDYIKFNSVLENSKIYLDTSIEKFNSMLFSMDTDHGIEFSLVLEQLKSISNKLIQDSQKQYVKIKKCNDENYNMFCDNDPQINLFKTSGNNSEIYNKIFGGYNMFENNDIDKRFEHQKCQKTHLLHPISEHKRQLKYETSMDN
jgi:hypothetical protein